MDRKEKLKSAEESEEIFESLTEEEEKTARKLTSQIVMCIKAKRKALGMTKKDLAKKLNVSQSVVSRWENGEENFSIETLAEIAVALEMDLQNPFLPSSGK